MEEKTIEIRGIGHPTDDLMTVSDPNNIRYLVFDKAIFPHLGLGKIIQLTDDSLQMDIPKKSGDGTYNVIKSILVEGKKIGGKARKGYAPRNRDEDRTDRRNAIITIKDIWLGGKIKDDNPLVTWMLAELLVIATVKKEAKSESTQSDKDSKVDNQPKDKGEGSGQGSNEVGATESQEVKTLSNLLNWLLTNGASINDGKPIKNPRQWLRNKFSIPDREVITNTKAIAYYKTLTAKKP